MQKAVVSTSVGAEGIRYTKGENILIGDTPDDFADQVVNVLDDKSIAAAIGPKARQLVLEHYDWKIVGEKLKKIYEEITRER